MLCLHLFCTHSAWRCWSKNAVESWRTLASHTNEASRDTSAEITFATPLDITCWMYGASKQLLVAGRRVLCWVAHVGDCRRGASPRRAGGFKLNLNLNLNAQVAEGDFLEVVTTTPRVVCHFFHRDFERCKLLDQHLAALARMYLDTRFIRLSAPVRACHAVETLQKCYKCH